MAAGNIQILLLIIKILLISFAPIITMKIMGLLGIDPFITLCTGFVLAIILIIKILHNLKG